VLAVEEDRVMLQDRVILLVEVLEVLCLWEFLMLPIYLII
jgi:hypothetical protein